MPSPRSLKHNSPRDFVAVFGRVGFLIINLSSNKSMASLTRRRRRRPASSRLEKMKNTAQESFILDVMSRDEETKRQLREEFNLTPKELKELKKYMTSTEGSLMIKRALPCCRTDVVQAAKEYYDNDKKDDELWKEVNKHFHDAFPKEEWYALAKQEYEKIGYKPGDIYLLRPDELEGIIPLPPSVNMNRFITLRKLEEQACCQITELVAQACKLERERNHMWKRLKAKFKENKEKKEKKGSKDDDDYG